MKKNLSIFLAALVLLATGCANTKGYKGKLDRSQICTLKVNAGHALLIQRVNKRYPVFRWGEKISIPAGENTVEIVYDATYDRTVRVESDLPTSELGLILLPFTYENPPKWNIKFTATAGMTYQFHLFYPRKIPSVKDRGVLPYITESGSTNVISKAELLN